MKRSVPLILIYSLCAIAALSQQSSPPSPNAVVHVATALNHLTVLEFHEPVTMAAAGSSDFQIERESKQGLRQAREIRGSDGSVCLDGFPALCLRARNHPGSEEHEFCHR